MTRKHRLIRWVTFGVSASLAALALLDSGADPGRWFAWLHRQTQPPKEASVAASPPRVPKAVLPARVPSTPVRLPGSDSSISRTAQELVLTGTVLGRNFREGSALLGVARENPQTYAVGALLANGARLTEVHAKYVVLERAGHSARLYLDGAALHPSDRRSSSDVLSVGGEQRPAAAVANSTELLTDYLRPTPVYDGDMLVGYQVYPGAKPGVFSQLGLQSGDVITAIDGAPFVDPAQAIATLHELTNGIALSALVTRKGKSQLVNLDGTIIVRDQERTVGAGLVSGNSVPAVNR
jgi:type II secretion system protein C